MRTVIFPGLFGLLRGFYKKIHGAWNVSQHSVENVLINVTEHTAGFQAVKLALFDGVFPCDFS